MATAASPAPPATPQLRGVQPLRAGEGHSFFWRKLHSLTGIVPIGAFLIEHIISNFETVNGPLAYAKQVLFLNSLPLVRILEWAFIFIPLAFHAFYGLFIAIRGRVNVNVYPWAGNFGYLTQRITGLINPARKRLGLRRVLSVGGPIESLLSPARYLSERLRLSLCASQVKPRTSPTPGATGSWPSAPRPSPPTDRRIWGPFCLIA